jgi:hypothetical protein
VAEDSDRIGSVVVAALPRTRRGSVPELELAPQDDGIPTSALCLVLRLQQPEQEED